MCPLKIIFHDGRQAEDHHAESDTHGEGRALWTLEEGQRLSQSVLWELQKSFYDQEGVKAWSDGTTPFYITSNPFIGRAYAQVILGFLRDWQEKGTSSDSEALDPNEPVYIVELGAGSGRLGFHVLKELMALKRGLSVDEINVCYVMTDFTESNLNFWSSHPVLKPFVDRGVLDFALFDAGRQTELTLARSGKVLATGTVKNPIVVIANYVFDSLPQDILRFQEGRLYESLLTITSSRDVSDPGSLSDPEIFDHVDIELHDNRVGFEYYDDPIWNSILRRYGERLGDTSILFPSGPLTCIKNLLELSRGRMLLLSADKGFNSEEDLARHEEFYIVVHGGFSFRVNYDAIGEYFRRQGGAAFKTQPWDTTFLVSGFLSGGVERNFPETASAFRQAIEGFGPYYFYTLLTATQKDLPTLSLEHVLCLWRLSNWDPMILRAFGRVLLGKAEFVSPLVQQEIRRGLDRTWENYFPIGEKTDLPFEMARILHEMKYLEDAARYYARSLDLFGPQYATLYNMGTCLYELGRFDEALGCFDVGLELEPDDNTMQEWRERTMQALEGGRSKK